MKKRNKESETFGFFSSRNSVTVSLGNFLGAHRRHLATQLMEATATYNGSSWCSESPSDVSKSKGIFGGCEKSANNMLSLHVAHFRFAAHGFSIPTIPTLPPLLRRGHCCAPMNSRPFPRPHKSTHNQSIKSFDH